MGGDVLPDLLDRLRGVVDVVCCRSRFLGLQWLDVSAGEDLSKTLIGLHQVLLFCLMQLLAEGDAHRMNCRSECGAGFRYAAGFSICCFLEVPGLVVDADRGDQVFDLV